MMDERTYDREAKEAREERELAPYAMKSARSAGRVTPEPADLLRTCWERDRDRLVHCTAFRRLMYKTQVFINRHGDHQRTRLSHSLEVHQVARSVGSALGLNEPLCEALALAHDIGHPPFGHRGEDALNELMEAHGGFRHNAQVLRVVDVLERRSPTYCGLNLTREVRVSLLKHEKGADWPAELEPRPRHPWLEAQVVDPEVAVAVEGLPSDDEALDGIVCPTPGTGRIRGTHCLAQVGQSLGVLEIRAGGGSSYGAFAGLFLAEFAGLCRFT